MHDRVPQLVDPHPEHALVDAGKAVALGIFVRRRAPHGEQAMPAQAEIVGERRDRRFGHLRQHNPRRRQGESGFRDELQAAGLAARRLWQPNVRIDRQNHPAHDDNPCLRPLSAGAAGALDPAWRAVVRRRRLRALATVLVEGSVLPAFVREPTTGLTLVRGII
jgi:hypothetical protein